MPIEDSQIAKFVQEATGYQSQVGRTTTLQTDIGLYGDDMDEFLEAFASRFSVDMSSYLWYFHSAEEGMNIGALFFRPPNRRVEQIPISIGMLCEFANTRAWRVAYPEHSVPRYRWDLIVTKLFSATVAVLVAAALAWKYL